MTRVQPILALVWGRFLLLGWIGRVVAIIITLYGTGWVVGTIGLHGMARQLGSAALFIFGVLLAFLFIRLIWRDTTSHHRRP